MLSEGAQQLDQFLHLLRQVDSPPRIEPPTSCELGELLTKTWPKAAFEEYAVARGLL